jgi:hypothetical protein
MTCDICKKEILDDNYYCGRWVLYCEDCKISGEGEKVDCQKTFDNEIAPDIEEGDFTYTMEHGLTDYLFS